MEPESTLNRFDSVLASRDIPDWKSPHPLFGQLPREVITGAVEGLHPYCKPHAMLPPDLLQTLRSSPGLDPWPGKVYFHSTDPRTDLRWLLELYVRYNLTAASLLCYRLWRGLPQNAYVVQENMREFAKTRTDRPTLADRMNPAVMTPINYGGKTLQELVDEHQ